MHLKDRQYYEDLYDKLTIEYPFSLEPRLGSWLFSTSLSLSVDSIIGLTKELNLSITSWLG